MRKKYDNKKYNRKYLCVLILLVFLIIFFLGSYFIYSWFHSWFHNHIVLVAIFTTLLSSILGIIEFILFSFTITDPYFQNSEDFEINEIQDDNKKKIIIRYKNYEFEFFDKFDINQMNCYKRNNKTISIIDKYRIKRYYKYALLNILNKPMDLKKLEQYKSVRKATNDEILEFTKIIEKKNKSIIRSEFISMLRFVIPFALLCSISLMVYKLNAIIAIFVSILASFVVFLCMEYTDEYERYRGKQEKNTKMILKYLNNGQLFIIQAKELLYDFKIRLFTRYAGNATRLAIFVDNEGNYINKWVYDGVIPYYRGKVLQEFPDNVSIEDNIYIIKYDGKILVDTKIDFKG